MKKLSFITLLLLNIGTIGALKAQAWVTGGNTVGTAVSTIGSNDDKELSLETSGITRLKIGNNAIGGKISIPNSNLFIGMDAVAATSAYLNIKGGWSNWIDFQTKVTTGTNYTYSIHNPQNQDKMTFYVRNNNLNTFKWDVLNLFPNGSVSVGTPAQNTSKFSIKGDDATSLNNALLVQNGSNDNLLKVQNDGKVVIGAVSSAPSAYKLFVETGILTEKVKVALKAGDWADYVFADHYKLKTLEEVEKFVKENKHLPGMPSAEALEKEGGIDVNQMFAKQMEKIEELMLYTIELNKKIEQLQTENNNLQSQMSSISKQ